MELPLSTPDRTYQTLDEIRQRKDELVSNIRKDNDQFSGLWNQLFVSRKNSSKGEWIGSIVANSITAVDAFLLVRKLMKNYGHFFGKKKRR